MVGWVMKNGGIGEADGIGEIGERVNWEAVWRSSLTLESI